MQVCHRFSERLIGLMFARKTRVLFFPGTRSVHTFFVFCRPDIVFLDDKGTMVRIVNRAMPFRVFFCKKARHVMELPAPRKTK